jgi:hypothetical protein
MDISPIGIVREQSCARFPQLRRGARSGLHIPQQRRQGRERVNIDIGKNAKPIGAACRSFEHPGRYLQPPIGCRTGAAAPENLSARLLDHLMNVNLASGPWMPRINKLAFLGPVGVPSSRCTTRSAHTVR